MNSDQFLYSNNIPEYTTPDYSQINYNSSQNQIYETLPIITPVQDDYQSNDFTYNQTENINYGDITYTTPNIETNQISSTNIIEDNNINQLISESNNINRYESYPVTNYNIPTSNVEQTNNYQFDYNNTNIEVNTDLNIENTDQLASTNLSNNNIINSQINPIENNIETNIIGQTNVSNQMNHPMEINTNPEQTNPPSFPDQIIDNNTLLQSTKIIQNELNKSHPPTQSIEKKVNSPKLINPLETKIPPSPSIPDMKEMPSFRELPNEQEVPKIETKEENLFTLTESKNLTKDEKNLLKDESKYIKKDLDIKSHFDLTLIKDENEFFYKKVHKISTPLLGHYEMPDNLEYKKPIISPNQKFLACIGKGEEDSVFVWEMRDLYWYKYKFSYSNVDCISFTPNSKSIIIVYSNSYPIMYDLSNGKTQLEFEMNGENNNREILQCAFTNSNTHFALTTTKSYTLWSLRTGKIKQHMLDDSPIKIISNEHIIYINSHLNCYIKKIIDQSIIESFDIKGIESTEEILDARCTRDMANLVYVIKHGIIVYNFKNKEFNGLQKFQCGVEKATLSQDGKYIMKTNMKNLCIYDLEKGENIFTLLNDRFKEYKIDYTLKKLILIDNISITIQGILDDKSPEKYVWLNKNPTKFEDVKFSRDCKILLARLNRNDAVVYDLKTGYILKKWENVDENWLDYCMTPFGGDKIAVKTNLFLINIWNFANKKQEEYFYGFNSHSMCFSSDANYLACGTKNGSEIARIWNIPEQKYGIFKYNGNNNNFHTMVHLTSPVPKRLICCSVDQQPLIFNSYTKELLFKCECPYRFEEIYEILSELRFNIFIVKGRDNHKRNIGIIYRISDGVLLQTFENYTVLDLIRFEGIVISKCEGGKLIATDYKMLDNPVSIEFQLQSDNCKLMNDHKSVVIEYGDEFNKEYSLMNIKNGNFIGQLKYVKKSERYSEVYITADNEKEEIYFRHFEFLTPQETMVYLKKNIFNVEEESG